MLSRRASLYVVVALAVAIGSSAMPAQAASVTFTVTSIADTGDSTPDGACGSCTLREALQEANANGNRFEADRIHFNIPGNGPHTIAPATGLPSLTQSVVIDGYTQGDATSTAADDALENTSPQGATNAVLKIFLNGTAIPTPAHGLSIQEGPTTIRGLAIGGFEVNGISDFSNEGTRIEGNFVGTDTSGGVAVANGSHGVAVTGANERIGGASPAQRNLISGNIGSGVRMFGARDVEIFGNLIGTKADGVSDLSNTGDGVRFDQASSDVEVGGTGAAAPNTIAFNDIGVRVDDGTVDATILGNSIHSNDGLGIDLGSDGVTPNDRKDPDLGANRLQNFPVLISAFAGDDFDDREITGTLDSRPRTRFRIQFFSNAEPGLSEGREGKTFLRDIIVKTSRTGKASFAATLTQPPEDHESITATATNLSTGDTSEFSAPLELV